MIRILKNFAFATLAVAALSALFFGIRHCQTKARVDVDNGSDINWLPSGSRAVMVRGTLASRAYEGICTRESFDEWFENGDWEIRSRDVVNEVSVVPLSNAPHDGSAHEPNEPITLKECIVIEMRNSDGNGHSAVYDLRSGRYYGSYSAW